jgi:hypothetical protein
LNVVPLICSIGSMKRYEPDLVSQGAAIEVESVSEARCVIDDVIANPERLSQLRKNLPKASLEFFKQGDAAQTIATRLLEVCESTVGGALYERA